MADSDSDDSLLKVRNFRPKRTETRKIAKGRDLLDAAEDHANRVFEYHERIHKIKQEHDWNEDDEDLLTQRNEQIIAEHRKPKVETTTDDRDSVFQDLEGVLTKERRADLGKAMEMDLTSPLGLRRTIVFDPVANDEGIFYFDQQTAMGPYISELKACLRRHVSHTNKTLQAAVIQPLRRVSTAKNSDDSKYFELKLFLEHVALAKQRQVHGLKEIPIDILLWLLRVACSPECIGVGIRYGAYETLQALLRQNKVFQEQMENTNGDATNDDNICSATAGKPTFLSVSQMAMQLQSWVHLATIQRPQDEIASKDDKNDEKGRDSAVIDEHNCLGLGRLLLLWITAFDADQISCAKGEAGTKDAMQLIILLSKSLIDINVQNPTRTHNLRDKLQIVLSKLLEFIRVEVMGDDETQLLEWMRITSRAIIDELYSSNLGPGLNKDDEQDEDALLSYAQVCRLLPHMRHDTRIRAHGRFQKSAAQFKSIFCIEALKHIFSYEQRQGSDASLRNQWDEEVHNNVTKCQNANNIGCDFVEKARVSLIWRALSSSLAAMVKINSYRSDLNKRSALCLAVVEIAIGSCLYAGMELFKGIDREATEDGEPSTINEYGSDEESLAVSRMFALLRIESTSFVSRIATWSTFNLLFQRASYFAQCSIKYFGGTMGAAAQLGKDREMKQNTMDSWVVAGKASKTAGDGDDDSDDAEGENEDVGIGSPLRSAKKPRLDSTDGNEKVSVVSTKQ